MKQIFLNHKGHVVLVETAMPVPGKGQALVKVLSSAISSGTEARSLSTTQGNSSWQKKTSQFVSALRNHGVKKTYEKLSSRKDRRVPLGYSCVGEIVEVGEGLDDAQKGNLVACMGSEYAFHAEYVAVPRNLFVKVPSSVAVEEASLITLGSIALHAVRNARVHMGETVMVVGMGLIGQIVSQLLALSGIRAIAVDIKEDRIALAKQLGSEEGVHLTAQTDFSSVLEMTNHHGVDAVIFCAGNTKFNILEKTALVCRDRGRFVIVGRIDLHLPWTIFYQKELEMVVSRSTGPGRRDPSFESRNRPYPRGYVRWTEQDNAQEIIRLLACKKLHFKPLLSHIFPFHDAVAAYRQLLRGNNLAIILDYTP